jgi:hypothetical protein
MKINDVLLTEGWRDEAEDFAEWSDYVRERLTKASPEQRPGLASQLSQLEVKHFGSSTHAGFNKETGKPIAGVGLTDTVRRIVKSFGKEADDVRRAQAAIDGTDGPAGNFSMPFGSVDVAGLEGASPEVLRVMKKAVMLGADVAAAARNFYKKHGTLTDQDLPKIQMSLANNASSEWKQQHSMAEGMTQAVDAKGRTQAQWLALVKAKFPPGGPVTVTKMIQAKMIDGPIIAYLSNGKQIGWKKVEQVEQIDEILNPTGLFAGIIRWAVDNPVIVAGLGVAGAGAAVGLTGGAAALGPLISAATGLGAGANVAVGVLTLDKLKDIIQSNPNQAENWFKQQIYKYIGDEADAKEFSLLHAKTAYLGKEQMFRWRAKEWPVTMKRDEAEAFLEKTEKFWLDSEKQKAIDAEKAKDDMVKEPSVAEAREDREFFNNFEQWKTARGKLHTDEDRPAVSTLGGKIIAKWDAKGNYGWVDRSGQHLAEGAESMTPNWAKYVLDQIYNSNGDVTLTDLFDEGIPGLHAMFMDIAQQHGLDPEEDFEDVQHELTLELEDLIKGGHDIDEGNKRSEADYGDDYQDMVARVKKLAGMGPLKTVYDPQKRVYKNVPVAQQPAQQPKKER